MTTLVSAVEAALAAVIELHSPEFGPSRDRALICSECALDGGASGVEHMPWPCPTIEAITAAGVEIKDMTELTAEAGTR